MMMGIDLNLPIQYVSSSFRSFEPHERHTTRRIDMDVLLIMLRGTLRFSEEGVETEVSEGEYYIQKKNTYQTASCESDCPQYFYIHFRAEWADCGDTLPVRGTVNVKKIYPLIKRMWLLQYNRSTFTECSAQFYDILLSLHRSNNFDKYGRQVSAMIDDLIGDLSSPPSIEQLAQKYHFSRNYIIRIFKNCTGTTPYRYLKEVRLSKAKELLTQSNAGIESITGECGYSEYSRFFRDFKERTGVSPREWRRSHSIDHSDNYLYTNEEKCDMINL